MFRILLCLLILVSFNLKAIAFDDAILNRNDSQLMDIPLEHELDTRRELETFREDQQLKEEQKNENEHEVVEEQSSMPPLPEQGVTYNPAFLLKGVVFEGNEIYADEILLQYYRDLLGQEVLIEDLVKATIQVTKHYVGDGYLTSQAFIPPQRVDDGIMNIVIVESKLGNINVEGNYYAKEEFLKNTVLTRNELSQDKVFNVGNVKQSLNELNKNNYIQGKIVIEQGDTPELTDITLEVEERYPMSLTFSADNEGRSAVGRERASLQIAQENLSGIGDRAYLGGMFAEGTHGLFTGYDRPINEKGTTVGISYGYSTVALGEQFTAQDIEGFSHNLRFGVKNPLVDEKHYKLSTDFNFDILSTRMDQNATTSKLSDYELRVLRAAINKQTDDAKGRWKTRLEGSLGINALGAGDSFTPAGTADAPETSFTKVKLDTMRIHFLPKNLLGIARMTAQYSPDVLFAAEQMQMGGQSRVRGYGPGHLLADYGVTGSFEVRTPFYWMEKMLPESLEHWKDSFKLAFFYDYGLVGDNVSGPSSLSKNFIHSVGVGLQAYLTEDVTASISLGMPIDDGDTNSGRLHFYLSSELDNFLFQNPKERL